MIRFSLSTAAVLAALVGLGASNASAGSYGPEPGGLSGMDLPRHGHGPMAHGAGARYRLPPVSGVLHLHPGSSNRDDEGMDGEAGHGPAIYDVRHGPRRAGWAAERRRHGYGLPEGRRFGPNDSAGGYGYGGAEGGGLGNSYGVPPIPPAGGLGVYSPGAYGPGPRIITIPSGYRASAGQWGCGCASSGHGWFGAEAND